MRSPVLVLAAVLLVAGCSDEPAPASEAGSTASSAASTSAAPPSAATPSAQALPDGADPVLTDAAPDLATMVLTASADRGPCPDASDLLSAATGTRIVYWQGDLSGSGPGCQWADVDTVTTQTFAEQRYWVGITFYAQVDPALLLQDPDGGEPGCTVTPEPIGVPLTALTRCTSVSTNGGSGIGDTTWTYYQADSSGAGVWELAVALGSQYPGDAEQLAATGLAGVVQVAVAAFGPR